MVSQVKPTTNEHNHSLRQRRARSTGSRTRRAPLLLGIILLLQGWMSGLAHALVVSASVDTTEVRLGETLRLTLRIDESNKGKEPDFSVLEPDFRLLNKQFGSNTRLTNRGINTETNWIITLLPKRKGSVTIPAINFDGVQSKPITLNVIDQPQQTQAQTSQQLVFLEAEVDASEVYVQQQVIFTLRLYKRTELHDPSLVMPDVENAVQEKLGSPRSFSKVVDGRDYEVIENRFAYFPQKSGTFVIPPAELNATIAVGGSGFLDPFLGMMGKQIRRESNGIEIKVRPKPDGYPANAAWLPTRHITVEETIKPDKQSFKVGEPITRVVSIEAAGVAASLLPPLPVPEGKGFKVYPEPAESRGLPDAKGVTSRRIETHAYIPTQPGSLTLPTVEIPYWNVQEDRLDKVTLAGHTLTITGKAPASAPAMTPTDNVQTEAQPLAAGTSVNTAQSSIWQWVSLGLLVTWLITLALWFIQIRAQKAAKTPTSNTDIAAQESLSRKRDALMQACKQQHPVAARKALVAWFKTLHTEHPVHSLGHVRQHAMSALLATAAQALEQTLYCPSDDVQWNSDALRKGIADEESQRRIKQRETKSQLQTLYP